MSQIKVTFTKGRGKAHPNEYKYYGQASMDTMGAYLSLAEELDAEDYEGIAERSFVFDDDEVDSFISEVQPGDKIGCVVFSGGWAPTCFHVHNIDTENGFINVQKVDMYSRERTLGDYMVLSREDISTGILMGYCEVLYRDGKVFNPSTRHFFKNEEPEEENK